MASGKNRLYNKGVRKERRLVNAAKAQGKLAFRSAGSHSPVDVCVIDSVNFDICLIQSKSDDISEKEKQKILEKGQHLNGMYNVRFQVL